MDHSTIPTHSSFDSDEQFPPQFSPRFEKFSQPMVSHEKMEENMLKANPGILWKQSSSSFTNISSV